MSVDITAATVVAHQGMSRLKMKNLRQMNHTLAYKSVCKGNKSQRTTDKYQRIFFESENIKIQELEKNFELRLLSLKLCVPATL